MEEEGKFRKLTHSIKQCFIQTLNRVKKISSIDNKKMLVVRRYVKKSLVH